MLIQNTHHPATQLCFWSQAESDHQTEPNLRTAGDSAILCAGIRVLVTKSYLEALERASSPWLGPRWQREVE